MDKAKKNDLINIILIAVIMLTAFVLLHDIVGTSLLGQTSWNSYTRQAMSWLNGRCDVDECSGLELAIFEGKYYVSFPPLPSVIMLPFAFMFGNATPDNLIIAAFCIATAICAYRILRRYGTGDLLAVFIAIFYVFGSNMLSMSLNGGVWFMAQAINMFLCTLAVSFFLRNARMASFICLGLAVGCRPFSAVYIVAFFILYFIKDYSDLKNNKNDRLKEFVKKLIVPALPLVIIAAGYMAYNYARFGSLFEFGHNYLPEFTEAEKGQFSLSYFLSNFKQLCIGPIDFDDKLNLSFTSFNGFMFFIANPIFLILFIRIVLDIIKKTFSVNKLIILLAMLLNMCLLCCHKTLGGWQFGARYTCDMIPFVIAYLFMGMFGQGAARKNDKPLYLHRPEIAIAAFGIMFNIFGAVELWLGKM